MATYFGGLNPIRVSAAVLATTASIANGATANLYTAPSNGYAQVTAAVTPNGTTGQFFIYIGGSVVARFGMAWAFNTIATMGAYNTVAGGSNGQVTSGNLINLGKFLVGPSQTIGIQNQTASAVTYAVVQGVQFING